MMCPNLRCRAVLGVPAEARGRTVRCRNCGCSIRIPKARPKPAEVDAEAAGEGGANDSSTEAA
jgi:hypothetical protein